MLPLKLASIIAALVSVASQCADPSLAMQCGRDGRDGKDGKDGRDGRDGMKGERGEKGDQGQMGDKGMKGDAGIAGPQGEKGECGKRFPSNIQQYIGTPRLESDSGTLQSFTFTKRQTKSSLRVLFTGNIRLMKTGGDAFACRRWYFAFNGTECSSPATIDMQYHESTSDNTHHSIPIEGICDNLAAGEVTITFIIGNCLGSNTSGDAFTCWASVCRFIVEEI